MYEVAHVGFDASEKGIKAMGAHRNGIRQSTYLTTVEKVTKIATVQTLENGIVFWSVIMLG